MNLCEILKEIQECGTSIAFIAKQINKDPSTISKWMRGTSKYLSQDTEEEIKKELRRIQMIWKELEI